MVVVAGPVQDILAVWQHAPALPAMAHWLLWQELYDFFQRYSNNALITLVYAL
jgi:hypothetical protein